MKLVVTTAITQQEVFSVWPTSGEEWEYGRYNNYGQAITYRTKYMQTVRDFCWQTLSRAGFTEYRIVLQKDDPGNASRYVEHELLTNCTAKEVYEYIGSYTYMLERQW